MKFSIATGSSRKEKTLINRELTWGEFLDRVKNTYRRSETVAEYKKLSKEKQDEIKDVGGFVGGKLKGGIRRSGYVEYRSMLTLDMDYAREDIWDSITMSCDNTCCIYSTHKHTPKSPRLRLIIPLKRVVSSDEYGAIARKVASDLGIEQFDDTTYEASRLMYWPSTSSDGEYVFKSKEGNLLDPDAVLLSYESWRDTSTWPVSSRQKDIMHRRVEKQADPSAKEGIVGSFCRAYCISSAIETFLSHVYSPCALPGRYTYIQGSSTAGLVTYEDKYAYSHHSTDPASSRLCNAFDLVRLHKFGELDLSCAEGTPSAKLHSYTAMLEFAASDRAVKRQMAKERMEKAGEEFASSDNWEQGLQYKKDGTLSVTIDNIRLILQNDPKLCGMVGYNEFSHRNELLRDLHWRGMDKGICWTDSDDAALRHYIERIYGISHVGKTMDASRLYPSKKGTTLLRNTYPILFGTALRDWTLF